ncbi:MAG: Lcl C-terminal domain-containing protein [Candidatus Heimdallarchaeaceae archaeon]
MKGKYQLINPKTIFIVIAFFSIVLQLFNIKLVLVTGISSNSIIQNGNTYYLNKETELTYPIVDTNQKICYDDKGNIISPQENEAFFGQDAQYYGNQPRYKDNKDGTITDLVTGLMWQKTPDTQKYTWAEAFDYSENLTLGGYTDWRVPTIKELYSLIDFNGNSKANPPVPYINTSVFDFYWGDVVNGERLIDAQFWSSTAYVGKTMGGDLSAFGVNFADGRIKSYPRVKSMFNFTFTAYVRCVRGRESYGMNNFVDNGDGTITDLSTGLMWMKSDSGEAMNWEDALAYSENLDYAGYSDWRLPNAKELQSIVNYSFAPDAIDESLQRPAIDPIFELSNETAWFWTSTTHLEGPGFSAAAYIAFGLAMGYLDTPSGKMYTDVHGAGAQRSDPKSGDPADYEGGLGPQGDEIRIYNYVRCVRSVNDTQNVKNNSNTNKAKIEYFAILPISLFSITFLIKRRKTSLKRS